MLSYRFSQLLCYLVVKSLLIFNILTYIKLSYNKDSIKLTKRDKVTVIYFFTCYTINYHFVNIYLYNY
jgi:hypothetical protein